MSVAAPRRAPLSASISLQPSTGTLASCVALRRNPWVLMPQFATPAARLIHRFPLLLAGHGRSPDAAVFNYWLYRNGAHPYGEISRPRGEGERALPDEPYGAEAKEKVGGRVYTIEWQRLQPSSALSLAQHAARSTLEWLLTAQARKLTSSAPPSKATIEVPPGGSTGDNPLELTAARQLERLRAITRTRPEGERDLDGGWLPLHPVTVTFHRDLLEDPVISTGGARVPPTGALVFGTASLYPLARTSLRKAAGKAATWRLAVSALRWEILDSFSFSDAAPQGRSLSKEVLIWLKQIAEQAWSDIERSVPGVLPSAAAGAGVQTQPLGTWTPEAELVIAPLATIHQRHPRPLIQLDNHAFQQFGEVVAQEYNRLRECGGCKTYPGALFCTRFWLHAVSSEERVEPAIEVMLPA